MKDFLEVRLVKSKDFHKDIDFQIKSMNVQGRFDSYYLLLDKGFKTEKEGYEKVADVMSAVLEGWVSKINATGIDEICFLPIDFSDQYVGCLRIVKLKGHQFQIMYGFTESVYGMDLYPSNVSKFNINDSDFEGDSPSGIIDEFIFLECIEESKMLLKGII